MLDVNRLRVIDAVARHGSVTAAAKELHYSRPSVTHRRPPVQQLHPNCTRRPRPDLPEEAERPAFAGLSCRSARQDSNAATARPPAQAYPVLSGALKRSQLL
jgi:hypothetical protein